MDSGLTVKGFLSLLKNPFLRVGKVSIEEILKACFRKSLSMRVRPNTTCSILSLKIRNFVNISCVFTKVRYNSIERKCIL